VPESIVVGDNSNTVPAGVGQAFPPYVVVPYRFPKLSKIKPALGVAPSGYQVAVEIDCYLDRAMPSDLSPNRSCSALDQCEKRDA
jgi:hypothetical protein